MSMYNITELMQKSLENLALFSKSREVYGEAIFVSDKVTVIPVTRISVGFATGGAEIGVKKSKLDGSDTPVGAIGGGVTMTPIGFLIIKDGQSSMIKADGDNGVEKWLDILRDTVKSLSERS